MLLATFLVLAPMGAVPSAAAASEMPASPPPDEPASISAGDDEEDDGDPDAPEGESEEMEALRALEENALDSAAVWLRSVRPLGPGLPVRHRLLEDPFRHLGNGEGVVVQPEVITDLLAFDVSLVADRYDIPVEMRP